MSLLHDLEAARRPAGCAGDLELSRLLAGELASEQAEARRAHVAGCDRCGRRLAELEVDRAAFVASPPWRLPAAAPPRRWLRGWRAASLGLAGAAAAALAIALVSRRAAEDVGGGTRLKGEGARFELFVERADRVIEVGEGDELRPGDRLQVVYSALAPSELAVLARDGAGAISVYFPPDGDTTWSAAAGDDVTLPASTELDDVVGAETLTLVTCARPTSLAALRGVVASGGSAPAGCAFEIVHLVKRAGP